MNLVPIGLGALALTLLVLGHRGPAADATPFGLDLGTATETELSAAFDLEPLGTSALSEGPVYALDPAHLGLVDAGRVTLIFDGDRLLQAVLVSFPRHRFSDLLERLQSRYHLVERHTPDAPGADRDARFERGRTQIVLDHPWLRRDLALNHVQQPLYQAAERARAAASVRRVVMGKGGL